MMLNLLFSPNGRIRPDEFTKGAVVLLAINFFAWLAWFLSFEIGALVGFLSFTLIFCWFCLFAKRFRSVGRSPGFFIPVFFVFIFLMFIITNIVSAFILPPDIVEKVAALQEMRADPNPDFSAMTESLTELMKDMAIPYSVGFFLAGTACAFGANRNLPANTP